MIPPFSFSHNFATQVNFLHHIAAIVLLSLLVCRDMSRPIIAADYQMNLERYKQACVNRSRPMSGCNGRCQMMRRMSAAEGQSPGAPVPPMKPFLGDLFFDTVCLTSTGFIMTYRLRHYAMSHLAEYSFVYQDDIFHPPSA